MTINRKIIFGGVYLFIGFCIETSLGQGVTCKQYTLVQLPGATPINGLTTQNTGRSVCESSCLNYASGGCYGFTWSNNICTVNTQSADALYHNASSSVDYYHLIRAYNDCDSGGRCSYVWSGQKNQHGSGATNANVNSLSDCIKFCQDSSSCAAFDWNAMEKTCWTYTSAPTPLYPADYLYFFSKNCTIAPTSIATTTPVRQSLTTLPGTPPLLSSSTSSSSSRIPSSSSTTITTTTKPSSSSSSSSSSSLKPSTLANQTSVSTTSTTVSTTTVSLCNGVKCNLGAECVVEKLNRSCVCISTCPSYSSSVCGSDNRTYSNDCELYKASCRANKTITLVRRGTCDSGHADQSGDGGGGGDGEFAHYPAAIKPAYIVLAGLGGGCLLLVLTAIIILCEYPLHGSETYSSSGTLVNGRGGYASQDIKMDSVGGGGGDGEDGGEGGGGEENVEFNPYYNRSELGAPDFTKEENIM